MQYTSVQSLREMGAFGSEDEDVLLNALIESATAIIDHHTHRKFAAEEETTRTFFRSHRRENAFLGQILYFDEDLAEPASLITDSPTVSYIPENNPPYFAMELTEGSWNTTAVAVTGYWAFSRTPPADIEFVCLRLSKWLYELRDATRGDLVMVTPEGRMLVPQGLPPDIATLLRPYVRVSIA